MQGFPRIFTAFIFAPLICFDRENDMASCPILYERRGAFHSLLLLVFGQQWCSQTEWLFGLVLISILYLKNILLFCAYGILCLFFTFIYIHVQRKKNRCVYKSEVN